MKRLLQEAAQYKGSWDWDLVAFDHIPASFTAYYNGELVECWLGWNDGVPSIFVNYNTVLHRCEDIVPCTSALEKIEAVNHDELEQAVQLFKEKYYSLRSRPNLAAM